MYCEKEQPFFPVDKFIGVPIAEYALIASLAIGTAAGVAAIGRATFCDYSLVYSVLLAVLKNGPALIALEGVVQPQCIIPIHKVDVPLISFRVAFAQFFRGKPMLLNYWGPERSYPRPDKRREICAPIKPILKMLVPLPGDTWSCDEYPFYSTIQGGVGASLMPMPSSINSLHGGKLVGFYLGSNYQGLPILPGGMFAAVPI